MKGRSAQAIFLAVLMVMSGCLSSETPIEDTDENVDNIPVSAWLVMDNYLLETKLGDIVMITGDFEITPVGTEYSILYDIISPTGIRDIESSILEDGQIVKILFSPDEPGDWAVVVKLYVGDISDPIISQSNFFVNIPNEGITISGPIFFSYSLYLSPKKM